MSKIFRVWCLSWDDTEDVGMDVIGYDPLKDGWKSSSDRRAVWVPFRELTLDAEEAAEAYAEYCHGNRDGWEASWPLAFRVRSPDDTTEDYEVDREVVPEFSATKLRRAG